MPAAASPRCLVLGLGAVGTYVGAHIAAAGLPVTVLVRPGTTSVRHAAEITVTCPERSFTAANVAIVDHVEAPVDIVTLACKTFHVDAAIESVRPAVGERTVVLPILNGMAHVAALDAAFSARVVWGGVAHFSVVKRAETHVQRLSPNNDLIAGPRHGGEDARIAGLMDGLRQRGIAARISARITHEMWEKWVFIVTLAGLTSLMRGSVGDIVAQPGGRDLAIAMFDEAVAAATAAGYPPARDFVRRSTEFLTRADSPIKASLQRDIEAGHRTEVDALMADFVNTAKTHGVACPLFDLATLHVLVYEASRDKARP